MEGDPRGVTSILLFGKVVKERHQAATQAAHRDEHHHAACFCTQRHYWNKVAALSREKYNVPLNAVAHDGYGTMYAYLTAPTSKKPLPELDPEPYLSRLHPRGDGLTELLTRAATTPRQN